MKFTPIKTSFNAGIFSPLMAGRTDIDKYAAACEEMTNFLPTVQGAAIKRPGTKYVANVKTNANRTWLSSFVFNYQQAFVLEFGVNYIRFYNNYTYLPTGTCPAWSGATAYVQGNLVSRSGVNYWCKVAHTNHQPPNSTYWLALTSDILEVYTPYTANDLTTLDGTFALSTVQSGDVIYIACRGFPPKKLVRHSNTFWSLDDFNTKLTPFQNNNTDKSIKVSIDNLISYIGSDFVEYDVDLTSTSAVFTNSMIGTNMQFTVTDDPVIKPWAGQLGTAKTTDAGDVIRNDNKYYGCNLAIGGKQAWYVSPIHTEGGRWDGDEISWWYLADQNGVMRIKTVTSSTVATATVIRQIANTGSTSNSLTSVAVSAGDSFTLTSGSAMSATNNAVPGTIGSPATITNAIDAITLTGDLVPVFTPSTTTDEATTWAWSKSAWNPDDGYPTKVSLFRDRLVFARDQTLWFSVSSDYENFSAEEFGQVLDDSAITISVPFDQVSQINYMVPTKSGLIVGSTDGEALVTNGSVAEPFSPTNIKIDLTSRYGSRNIAPLRVDDAVIFIQRAGRKVREAMYDINTDNIIANDITVYADNITAPGIISMAFQREPYNVLWCARSDGVLLGFTYNRAQNVTGWHTHKLGGTYSGSGFGVVEAVQVIPSYDGTRDDLWMIVRRTINGFAVRYIEYMTRGYDSALDVQSGAYYSDCGSSYNGASTTSLTGLTWLPSTEVSILANGAVHPNKTASSGGVVTTDYAVTIAQVGLPYSATLSTMKLDGGTQQGTAQGKKKRVTEIMTRVLNTAGLEIGLGEGSYPYQEIDYRDSNTPMGTPTPLFSGDKTTVIDAQVTESCNIKIRSQHPLPATVVALSPLVEVYDK